MKFTALKLQSLKSRPERYEVWEDNGKGFGLRVSPTGRKTFVFLYRFKGTARRMTLGVFPSVSLAEAHKLHAQARVQLERGVDPGATHVAKKKEDAAAPTIESLIAEYLEKHAMPRKRSWREDERILKRELMSEAGWGRRKARDITRRDILQLLDGVLERGSPVMANRVFAVVRKMFNFAISRDIVDVSPCTAVAAPATEMRRERTLNEAEIKIVWRGLDSAPITNQTRIALKLVLSTAQRSGEVVGAKAAEFDLENGWWTIPGERAKNSLPHRVPLNDVAFALVREALSLSDSEFLFPSVQGTHIQAPALNRALARLLRKPEPSLDVAHFTPHDLRRTAASQMGSLGVSRFVLGKVLNHAEKGVTAVYDRHTYDAEKRKALDIWGRKLDNVLTEKKASVVTLSA